MQKLSDIKVSKMIDIVFPKNNEEEFLEIAEKLNITGLCFAYPVLDKDKVKKLKERLNNLKNKTKIYFALLVNSKDIQKAKKLADLIIVQRSKQDREAINLKADLIFDLETSKRKDMLNLRRSGLNQVLCKLATNKQTIIGINFSNILESKEKSKLIGRIKQNIRFCRKYNTNMAIASFAKDKYQLRSESDLKSFLFSIGMTGKQANNTLNSIEEKIKFKFNKKRITKGVYITSGSKEEV